MIEVAQKQKEDILSGGWSSWSGSMTSGTSGSAGVYYYCESGVWKDWSIWSQKKITKNGKNNYTGNRKSYKRSYGWK